VELTGSEGELDNVHIKREQMSIL